MLYADISSKNVRALMNLKHLSIRQIADAISVSASTLTDALKSKNGLSIDMLAGIATFFGVSVSALCCPDFDPQNYSALLEDYQSYARSYRLLDIYGRELVDLVFRKELERCCKTAFLLVPSSGSSPVNIPEADSCKQLLK